jgi:hypothetical protein
MLLMREQNPQRLRYCHTELTLIWHWFILWLGIGFKVSKVTPTWIRICPDPFDECFVIHLQSILGSLSQIRFLDIPHVKVQYKVARYRRAEPMFGEVFETVSNR